MIVTYFVFVHSRVPQLSDFVALSKRTNLLDEVT